MLTSSIEAEALRPRPTANSSSEDFVRQIWESKFSGAPSQVLRYRMMLSSPEDVVYFQNFNKAGSPNLWYRLQLKPLNVMRSMDQKAWICLTNPAEHFGYLIPLVDLDQRAKEYRWTRDEFEVNIDAGAERYRELNWNLRKYRVMV